MKIGEREKTIVQVIWKGKWDESRDKSNKSSWERKDSEEIEKVPESKDNL